MTIREIAQRAGISPAAVSLVLNHKKGVSEETRKRVLEIVDEAGYTPAPRKESRSNFRLMVLKYRATGSALEENQGFIASIIDNIERECRRFGYDMVMCSCSPATGRTVITDLMNNTPPDGVILIATEMRQASYDILDLFRVPVVLLDNNIDHGCTDCVVMDNKRLMGELVNYVYSCGHRDIGYLMFAEQINNCEERYQGYLKAMTALGLPKPQPILLRPTVDGAYSDMAALIREGKYIPHGAVVSDNDTIAIGAIKAIREAGYNIPGDISITGFDDIPFSATTMPALTTMRISRSALGELAVGLLRNRVTNPNYPPMKLLIGGKLILRDSVRNDNTDNTP